MASDPIKPEAEDQKVGELLRSMPNWYALWHTEGKWYCGQNRRPPEFLDRFDSPYRALLSAAHKHPKDWVGPCVLDGFASTRSESGSVQTEEEEQAPLPGGTDLPQDKKR
jgi:hypothetical protein